MIAFWLSSKRLCAACLLVFLFLRMGGVPVAATSPKSAPRSPTICPGIPAKDVSGVDILILFDNSKSLDSTADNYRPSDPLKKRFQALQTLFESLKLGLKKELAVNVFVYKFSQKAEKISEFSTIDDPVEMKKEVEDKIGATAHGTNYIDALDSARNFFEERKELNLSRCKFLIWFTDGEFSFSTQNEADREKNLNKLVQNTCSSPQWGEELRKQNVNTYVVLLGNPDDLRTKKNFQESLNLMAQITGDYENEPLGTAVQCPGDMPQSVGEIFSAEEAEKLTPVFQRIGAYVSGASDIEPCPAKTDSIQTKGLPHSKFFKTISIISMESKPLPNPEIIFAVLPSKEEKPIEDFFSISGESKTEMILTPKQQKLEKGWKLKIMQDGADLCLLGTLIDPPQITLTQRGSSPAETKNGASTNTQLSDEELKKVVFRNNENQIFSADDVLIQWATIKQDLIAELDIEDQPDLPVFGKKLSLIVDNPASPEPEINCLEPFIFKPTRSTGENQDTPSNRDFQTSSCTIKTGPSKLSEVFVSIKPLVDQLQSETTDGSCKEVDVKLLINGVEYEEFQVLVSSEITVALNLKVGKTKTLCSYVAAGSPGDVVFTYGDNKENSTQVEFSFDFSPPPPFWPPYFYTLLFLLIAANLSLLLLRSISKALAVMPTNVYSFETIIAMRLNARNELDLSVDGVDVNRVQVPAAELGRPGAASTKSSLVLQNIRLERKLGGFFKPFSEARAEIRPNVPAVYWKSSVGGGLAIPFNKAIVVSSTEKLNSSTDVLSARLTIIVPTSNADGNLAEVQSLLQGQKVVELCRRYWDIVQISGVSLPVVPGGETTGEKPTNEIKRPKLL